MYATVPVPAKGDALQASWGAAVAHGINGLARMAAAGMLVREGVGCGTEALPRNERNRKQAETVHPWKVYALTQSEDVDHCFEVYVPANAITVGAASPEIEGLTAVEGETERYTIDDEGEIADDSTIYIAVLRTEDEETDGVSADDEEETSGLTAKVIVATGSTIPEPEDGEAILSIFPVAKVSVDSTGDYPVGKIERQLARSIVALTEPGNEPDGISTDTVTDEDADDPNAIQIKDFDNDESDGGQGLVERLEIVKDGDGEGASYRIEAKENKSSVFLLARVNGKIKYIPLTGAEEPDPDEEEPGESEPCHDHPGDTDGIEPTDEDSGGVGGESPDTTGAGDGEIVEEGEAPGGVDPCCD